MISDFLCSFEVKAIYLNHTTGASENFCLAKIKPQNYLEPSIHFLRFQGSQIANPKSGARPDINLVNLNALAAFNFGAPQPQKKVAPARAPPRSRPKQLVIKGCAQRPYKKREILVLVNFERRQQSIWWFILEGGAEFLNLHKI